MKRIIFLYVYLFVTPCSYGQRLKTIEADYCKALNIFCNQLNNTFEDTVSFKTMNSIEIKINDDIIINLKKKYTGKVLMNKCRLGKARKERLLRLMKINALMQQMDSEIKKNKEYLKEFDNNTKKENGSKYISAKDGAAAKLNMINVLLNQKRELTELYNAIQLRNCKCRN